MALGRTLSRLIRGRAGNRRLRGPGGGPSPLQEDASRARLGMGVFVGLTVLAIVTLGADFVWQRLLRAPSFGLGQVELRGANRLGEAEVLETAELELGAPLLGLRLGRSAQQLLAHPWIEAVQLRRHLPNRLHIAIVEHVPRALAMLDELWLVNPRGEPFKRFEAQDHVVLPVVTGLVPTPRKGAAAPEASAAVDYEHDAALRAQLGRSLKLIDHFAALRPGTLALEELHHDLDLGTSVTLLVQPKGRQPGPARVLVAHLGHEPEQRSAQMLSTLDTLAGWGLWPEEVWLGLGRQGERVMMRLTPATP